MKLIIRPGGRPWLYAGLALGLFLSVFANPGWTQDEEFRPISGASDFDNLLLTQVGRQRPGSRERDTRIPPPATPPAVTPPVVVDPPVNIPTQQTTPAPVEQPVQEELLKLSVSQQNLPVYTPLFSRRPGEPPARPFYPPRRPGAKRDFEVGDGRRPGPQLPEYVDPDPLPDPNRKGGLGRTPKPDRLAPREYVEVPDRWKLAVDAGLRQERWYDPYNFNVLKADRPLFDDWFFSLSVISDSVFEPRKLPTPVGPQAGINPGILDIFGGREQILFNQNLAIGLVLYKGNTVFKPPDYEFRITPVVNYNFTEVDETRVLHIDPADGDTRHDNFVGMQELFADVHLRNVSDRYDFDSIRVGIQPFSTDFRGFLFQDNQLGIRLFGTRDNNFWQYNLAWFRRVEKDTNSGLNDIWEDIRDDDIFIASLYRQDWPVLGFTSQATVVHNRNREDDKLYFDDNGFLVRPASLGQERLRNYDVTYIGYNGDGHFGRLNLTASTYFAIGDESVGTFTDKASDIRAFFAAAEASMDFDWIRLRASALYASGDDDPFDDRSEGFDAIFENPIFAGGDTSFWVRQAVPLVGGGGVTLSGRNGILNSLRSSKELGQSNFTNPGLILLGLGADFDLTPELRLSANINRLWFDETAILEAARNQGPIDDDIGWDISTALIYRPLFSQNIVFRLSGAVLIPGDGFEDLYGDDLSYSILGNLILTY